MRALGVSNFSIAQMEEFRSWPRWPPNQPPYNLFDRQIECGAHGENILSWCEANNVAVLSYSPSAAACWADGLRAA